MSIVAEISLASVSPRQISLCSGYGSLGSPLYMEPIQYCDSTHLLTVHTEHCI